MRRIISDERSCSCSTQRLGYKLTPLPMFRWQERGVVSHRVCENPNHSTNIARPRKFCIAL